jgi:hypothetical protein
VTAKLPNHPSSKTSATSKLKTEEYPTLKKGVLNKPLVPVTEASSHGRATRISIELNIANATIALLGKAFNIA